MTTPITDADNAQPQRKVEYKAIARSAAHIIGTAGADAYAAEKLMSLSLAAAGKSVADPDIPDYLLMGTFWAAGGIAAIAELAIELRKWCKLQDREVQVFPDWLKSVKQGRYQISSAIYPAIISGAFFEYAKGLISAIKEVDFPVVTSQGVAAGALALLAVVFGTSIKSNLHVLNLPANARIHWGAMTLSYATQGLTVATFGAVIPMFTDATVASFMPANFSAFNNSAVTAASGVASGVSTGSWLASVFADHFSAGDLALEIDFAKTLAGFAGNIRMVEAGVSLAADQLPDFQPGDSLPLTVLIPALVFMAVALIVFGAQVVPNIVRLCRSCGKQQPQSDSTTSVRNIALSRQSLLPNGPKANTYGTDGEEEQHEGLGPELP